MLAPQNNLLSATLGASALATVTPLALASDRYPAVVMSSSLSQRLLPQHPCFPNRVSYYARAETVAPPRENPKRWDTQFSYSLQPNDIVFDVVTVSAAELKLQWILTTPTAAGKKIDRKETLGSAISAGALPTTKLRRRLHVDLRRGGRGG